MQKPATNLTKKPKSGDKTRRPKQLALLKREKSAFGGQLRNTREGRSRGRPLATRETMHLVLRSTQAKGTWSFRNGKHARNIEGIVSRFAKKYGVTVMSLANVGNHLHFQIKLANRRTYQPFIRAITGAIAMAVTGRTRWAKPAGGMKSKTALKFWDFRPFTRIVRGLRARLTLKDYIRINQLEGEGYKRDDARFMMNVEKNFERSDH